METGKAFCAENTATTAMISNASIKMLILPLLKVFLNNYTSQFQSLKANPDLVASIDIADHYT